VEIKEITKNLWCPTSTFPAALGSALSAPPRLFSGSLEALDSLLSAHFQADLIRPFHTQTFSLQQYSQDMGVWAVIAV